MVFCKRDRKQTECSLRNAAARLFARKGYENTRTLEIAKEAGANEALINRYFGGKEGLLMAVLHDESSAPDLVRVEGLDSGHGSLKGAIRAYFEQGRRIIMEREEFIRIAMSRSLLQPELAVVIREKILDRQMKVLIDSLKAYLSEFRLSPAEIESFAMLLAGTNHTFNFLMRSVHQVEDAKIDAVFELLADSLIAKLEVRA